MAKGIALCDVQQLRERIRSSLHASQQLRGQAKLEIVCLSSDHSLDLLLTVRSDCRHSDPLRAIQERVRVGWRDRFQLPPRSEPDNRPSADHQVHPSLLPALMCLFRRHRHMDYRRGSDRHPVSHIDLEPKISDFSPDAEPESIIHAVRLASADQAHEFHLSPLDWERVPCSLRDHEQTPDWRRDGQRRRLLRESQQFMEIFLLQKDTEEWGTLLTC